MSAIFKTRKTPKHLIIREYEPRRRSRFTFVRAFLWLCVLLTLTGVVLMVADRTVGLV